MCLCCALRVCHCRVPACTCLLSVLLFLPGVLVRVAFLRTGSTALSRCQTALDHAFPKGVTRSARQSAQPRPLPVSRAAGIPSTRSPPVRTKKKTTIAQQTCVTCLRADRWVCFKRTPAHTHASGNGARDHSTHAPSALGLTLACEPEAVQEIIAPPLIRPSAPVFTHLARNHCTHAHPRLLKVRDSSRPLSALSRVAHPRALPHSRGLNISP